MNCEATLTDLRSAMVTGENFPKAGEKQIPLQSPRREEGLRELEAAQTHLDSLVGTILKIISRQLKDKKVIKE